MNRPEKLAFDLSQFVPSELAEQALTQQLIPTIAKDERQIRAIEQAIQRVPTQHRLHCADAREMLFLHPANVQLVVTSPPYWTLKEYDDVDGQKS